MNNPELMMVLFIGIVIMTFSVAEQMKWYEIPKWKSIPISAMLVVTGVIGSKIWFFVENGTFRGRSFYGVVFAAPIIFLLVAKVIRIPYGYVLDFCAPSGCITLGLVKIQCLRDGCCEGKVLYLDENYDYVRYPSQITEMLVFILIAVVLFCICRKKENRNCIYPYFLILYGGSRFFLNFLRGDLKPYALGLSAGSFWSVIAFVLGIISLILVRKKLIRTNEE